MLRRSRRRRCVFSPRSRLAATSDSSFGVLQAASKDLPKPWKAVWGEIDFPDSGTGQWAVFESLVCLVAVASMVFDLESGARIVVKMLSAPRRIADADSKDWYYWNADTDETTWIKPSAVNMALPPGWTAVFDDASGEYFFWHVATVRTPL